jgi:hypothetical protein
LLLMGFVFPVLIMIVLNREQKLTKRQSNFK